ncbi:uncharacterized protein N7477_005000 [Penicillium maclennaniae]|uniref:uncharacterized protein n=1 Tax=Penicillium maclennaniae TaxID=1343394 RepID=UPI00254107D1|nr:uncharacterized protein N7477_005000 [Penicillium maclennaniae]KAJ5675066.1 hypothetical protein N7477_005000 [Penicillium maclennaniae]
MAPLDHDHGGFVAFPGWENPPSFASGSEQSPSVSSSFEFHETPKDEPCLNGLPFSTADQKLSSFESPHMQFGESHFSGLDQTSQWVPSTFEPELSSQSYFSSNLTEAQHWSNPFPLAPSSLIPFSGLPYHMDTTLSIPGGETSMLIAEPSRPDNLTLPHSHSEPHPHFQPALSLSAQPRRQNQSEHSSPTSSADSIKASLHCSDSRDALLIEWKRCGLSYKDIKQIGGFKEAESTLRGRFRTLTKAKEQRVRKPKWTETDVSFPCLSKNRGNACIYAGETWLMDGKQIQLLVQAVSKYAESGVSWKKVAQHIWDHGGSYQFGNATCKKKWCEIHILNA